MAEKDSKLLPAYGVIGTDALKRERVIKRLHMRLEESGDLSFNSDTFDGAEAGADDIVTACRTLPFASETRLVTVTNASKLKKADVEGIVSYLDDPSPTTVLMLIADSLKPSSPLRKALDRIGISAVIDCEPPKARELPDRVVRMAQTHSLRLSPAGARKLIELVGEDTKHLDEELRKLSLSNADGDPDAMLGPDEVADLVAHINEFKPWEFVDAFSERDMARCSHMLSHMGSTSSYALIARCVSRLRELVAAKVAAQEGGDAQARLVKMLSLDKRRAFVARIRMEQASRFDMSELVDGISSSMNVEEDMKTGSDPDLAFQRWAFDVMGHAS